MERVELFGTWYSPFSYRVVWALKLKGIPYTYIEEDLSNKSTLLLNHNPVHKSIPVLVHAGKPIAESTVILEYIEETWPDKLPLLPKDPHHRSVARFWIKFLEDKASSVGAFFKSTSNEEQEKAIAEIIEILQAVEEHSGLAEKKFFGGDEIGMVDLVYGYIACWLGFIGEEVGVKLLKPHMFPHLHAWTSNFKQVPIIKENLPDADKFVLLLSRTRQMLSETASTSTG